MDFITLLYTSDLHGSNLAFRKLLNAALTYKVHAVIIGGDITGKAMVPIIRRGDSVYEGYLFGVKEVAHSLAELEALKDRISNVGFYPLVVEPDEARALEADSARREEAFLQLMLERIAQWVELAEQHLRPRGIQFYMMPGNDDVYDVDSVIASSDYVRNPDGRRFWLDDDHEIVGVGAANMTPWACPRDLEEEELQERLEQVMQLLAHPSRAVCVFHCPPYNSQLDLAPELDRDLRIVAHGGQVLLKPVGSKAVREIIERYQPLLALHGHIHESPGFRKIGRTLCVNPGSEYAEGILRAALINLERDRVKGYMPIYA